MSAVYYTLGVVIFALALVISIALHECGHMIPAKRFGARVPQFFVGFGRTLWSRTRGETEYGVKAIPLGGYVKIIGMLPPEPGADPGRVRKSNTGMFTQLVSDTRAAEWELVRPEDQDRLFYKLAWWQKVVVMGGGPAVNIVIAFFLFAGVFATYGNPGDREITPVVSAVSECVLPAAEATRACTPADPVAPAAAAGLKPGDRLISFDGVPISDWESAQKQIRANASGELRIVFERGGSEQTVTTNTLVTARPVDPDSDRTEEVGFLGVSPSLSDPHTGGPIYTVQQMGGMTKDVAAALVHLPVNVWGVAKAVVGLEERDPNGPVSVVGGGRIAGETASAEGFPIQDKVASLLMLIGGFNFFIGMLNLVPLVPLDGGHIAGALYEQLRRVLARLRGRPDPGFADVAKMLPVLYVVAGVLLVFGVVLIVGDIVAPIQPT